LVFGDFEGRLEKGYPEQALSRRVSMGRGSMVAVRRRELRVAFARVLTTKPVFGVPAVGIFSEPAPLLVDQESFTCALRFLRSTWVPALGGAPDAH
jgi:hypothetical protein